MKHQKGNILFLILIAVALFAALSYVVTNSSRSGESGISKDRAKIDAAEILQYSSRLSQALSRIKIINRCSENQISFERAPYDGSDPFYVNASAPSDFRCHVFHPNGGSVPVKKFPSEWKGPNNLPKWTGDFFFVANTCIPDIGTGKGSSCWNNGTNDDTELLMVSADINEELCAQINKRLSITKGTQGAGIGDFYNQSDPSSLYGGFKGFYRGGGSPTTSGHILPNHGANAACYLDALTNTNNFYYALLER